MGRISGYSFEQFAAPGMGPSKLISSGNFFLTYICTHFHRRGYIFKNFFHYPAFLKVSSKFRIFIIEKQTRLLNKWENIIAIPQSAMKNAVWDVIEKIFPQSFHMKKWKERFQETVCDKMKLHLLLCTYVEMQIRYLSL